MEIRGRRQLSLQLGEISATSVVGPYVSERRFRVEPLVRYANPSKLEPCIFGYPRIEELVLVDYEVAVQISPPTYEIPSRTWPQRAEGRITSHHGAMQA
jgi:hypothetical protein